MSSVLVTGCAGFIGMHVCLKLFEQGQRVVGVDSLNDYYPKPLKLARLDHLRSAHPSFAFHRADIADLGNLTELIKAEKVTKVVHLAAQAGVRYSIENPMAYQHSNLLGMTCVLEACRRNEIQHLTYASTSSVYGDNPKVPFVESDSTDQPVSFYAATKKANEVMASSYSHLYGLPATGLRFFTVYGPWGRPDMAMFIFTRAMLACQPINVLNVFRDQLFRASFTRINQINGRTASRMPSKE